MQAKETKLQDIIEGTKQYVICSGITPKGVNMPRNKIPAF